ncbi:MAG TPA: hypothetical protein VF909_05435 [Roseiflexaceae bacterium]
MAGESYQRTRHDKIFIATNASSFVSPRLSADIDALLATAQRNDRGAILRGLQRIVPEFQTPRLIEVESEPTTIAVGQPAPVLVAHQSP